MGSVANKEDATKGPLLDGITIMDGKLHDLVGVLDDVVAWLRPTAKMLPDFLLLPRLSPGFGDIALLCLLDAGSPVDEGLLSFLIFPEWVPRLGLGLGLGSCLG